MTEGARSPGSRRRATVLAIVASSWMGTPPGPTAMAAAAVRQEPAAHTDDRLLSVARATMRRVRYCALITRSSSGHASARTVDPLAPDSSFVVRFATNPRSRKLREIARDPRVTLYYFDEGRQGYVALQGRARIVSDVREKGRYWKDDWAPHYPDRQRHMALVEVTPTRLEVVSIADGIVGEARTWAAPAVRFPTGRDRSP